MKKLHFLSILLLCLLLLAAPALACSITIRKNAVPNNPRDFSFKTTGKGLHNFQLDDDGSNTNRLKNWKTFSTNVKRYSLYTITEDPAEGWTLTKLSCSKTGFAMITKDLANRRVEIKMLLGDVTCTFTNSRDNSCDTMDCDDGKPCTDDTCYVDSHGTAQCKFTNDDTNTCSDGNACTQTDVCVSGTCAGRNPVTCTADACNDPGICNPSTGHCSGQTPRQDGFDCDDGDRCNGIGTCQSGVCDPGTPVTCPDPDVCHDPGTCDPQTGTCSNPPRQDGSNCNDGNLCNGIGTCQSGVCGPGTPVTCPDPDVCHEPGTCDPQTGLCPEPVDVQDGTDCEGGTCIGGECVSPPPDPWVTDSGLCLFDRDPIMTGRQFDLTYTKDTITQAFELTSSQPGEFFFNIFYRGPGNEEVEITLPYPFITQGANPISVYSDVTVSGTCLIPGTEIASSMTGVTLSDYESGAVPGVTTTTVSVYVPPVADGEAFINMHLDYGLKKTQPYTQDGNDAIGSPPTTPDIADLIMYTFSYTDFFSGSDSVQNYNEFPQ